MRFSRAVLGCGEEPGKGSDRRSAPRWVVHLIDDVSGFLLEVLGAAVSFVDLIRSRPFFPSYYDGSYGPCHRRLPFRVVVSR
jgi:hypothetical protein